MNPETPEHEAVWVAYADAASRWNRLAETLVQSVEEGERDLDPSVVELLAQLTNAAHAIRIFRLAATHADSDTAAWARGMMEQFVQASGIAPIAAVQPGLSRDLEPEPGPVEAHLGEIVHYQEEAGTRCLSALTTIAGPRPELAIFGGAELIHRAREVPHFETPDLEQTIGRWHCACECGQVQAVESADR